MKTIKEWLETLESPYREQALENMINRDGEVIPKNLKTALYFAFVWINTPQGYSYWENLYDSL